jgi:hypothetical protein
VIIDNAGYAVTFCGLTAQQEAIARSALGWETIDWERWQPGERGWIGTVPVVCAAIDTAKKTVELYARRASKGSGDDT